ncbi:ABC transporter substrate-binding protein [Streptococcus cameli]
MLKKPLKKTLLLATTLVLGSLILMACQSETKSESDSDSDAVSVGILQYAEHQALTASREGFLEALSYAGYVEGKNLTVNYKNAQGDQSQLQTMSEQLAGENTLNLAIATAAAQSLLTADSQTSSLFTAVYDPEAAQLVDSLDKPGGNMTGASNASSVEARLDLILKVVPGAKKIGIFYASSEINAEVQAKEAEKILKEKGLEAVVKTISNTNDVQTNLESLAGQVDAIYIPTDNLVASAAQTVGSVLKEKKVPAVASDNGMNAAALISYGVDYHELGRQTGEMALKILKGAKPADLAVEQPKKLSLQVNEEMAEALGFSVEELENLK